MSPVEGPDPADATDAGPAEAPPNPMVAPEEIDRTVPVPSPSPEAGRPAAHEAETQAASTDPPDPARSGGGGRSEPGPEAQPDDELSSELSDPSEARAPVWDAPEPELDDLGLSDDVLEAVAAADLGDSDLLEEIAIRRDVERQWSGLIVTLGVALVGLLAIVMLLILAQGVALRQTGPGSFAGDFFHRVGIAASRSLGVGQSLTLVLAVVLVSLPSVVGRSLAPRHERRRVIALYGAIGVAVLIGIGTALGVRAELHLDQLQQQPTTPFRRWALATDVVGTLGIALVAFLGALAALPESGPTKTRRRPTPTQDIAVDEDE